MFFFWAKKNFNFYTIRLLKKCTCIISLNRMCINFLVQRGPVGNELHSFLFTPVKNLALFFFILLSFLRFYQDIKCFLFVIFLFCFVCISSIYNFFEKKKEDRLQDSYAALINEEIPAPSSIHGQSNFGILISLEFQCQTLIEIAVQLKFLIS